jgi:hypothetical protein
MSDSAAQRGPSECGPLGPHDPYGKTMTVKRFLNNLAIFEKYAFAVL